ncbi:hypothetical protein T459_23137 [Capsicum annuum]|uniref:Ubiquitin-like protease family profile domain-containing protein n=1 Tax=Capsicum annuum TaxID=4072 RepID=A0A2G2YRH6_CAPAN|nr:hypothetical protein T459_23137 [Capsicum annuum]
MNFAGDETSPQRFNPNIDQNLGENQDGTKFTIPGELLPSINAYRRKSITTHPSKTHEEEPTDEHLNDKKSESVVEDHCKINKENVGLSSKSELYVEVDLGSLAGHIRIFLQKHPFVYHPIDGIVDTKIVKKFMDWISVDLLKGHAKRSVHNIYSVDDPNLTVGGQEANLNEYINGFRMHAAVLWHTVENIYIPINIKEKYHWVLAVLSFSERCIFLYDSYESFGHYSTVLAEIEKLAEIIPLCLQACDFYDKKGINLQNHPRYKDKDSSDMFDVLFEENLPQQPSGSLTKGVKPELTGDPYEIVKPNLTVDFLYLMLAALFWSIGTATNYSAYLTEKPPSYTHSVLNLTPN